MKLKPVTATCKRLFGNRRILIYDIETSPLKGWLWRPGRDISVTHKQLDKAYNQYQINTIAYKWLGEKKVYCLTGANMIARFDALVAQADIVIGKNSDRFDNKHINTQRLLQGGAAIPQWLTCTDDLEKQLRRFFIFPSMSLDYISSIFGLGGKVKMEMDDWVDIENAKQLTAIKDALTTALGVGITKQVILPLLAPILYRDSAKSIFLKGKIAMDKMISYNMKDVEDTEELLIKVAPHIQLKNNAATAISTGKGDLCCTRCGSGKVSKIKLITAGLTKYAQFQCLSCNQYAGRATYYYDKHKNRRYGKMQPS